jgi:MFS family permease
MGPGAERESAAFAWRAAFPRDTADDGDPVSDVEIPERGGSLRIARVAAGESYAASVVDGETGQRKPSSHEDGFGASGARWNVLGHRGIVARLHERFDRSGTGGPGPLSYRAFRVALASRIASGLGSWMQIVAAGWLVYDITASGVAVGLLTIASKGPGLFLSGWGGELADRHDRRRIVIVTSAIQGLLATVLAVMAWDGETNVVAIYIPVLGMGIAGSLASPAQSALVMGTVPPELLRRATGLSSVAYNVARLAGPAIGGAVVVAVGAGACFALNALSDVVYIALVLMLPAAAGAHAKAKTPWHTAAETAYEDPLLRNLLIVALTFSVAVAPIQELAPAVAKSQGDGAHLLGFMLAALAAGGLIGNYVRTRYEERVDARHLLGAALLGSAASLGLVAVISPTDITIVSESVEYALILVGMTCLGAAWDILFVVTLTGVQLARKELSGVMTGFFFTVSLGGLSLGALALGALFDAIDIAGGLMLCAVLLAAAGTFYLTRSQALFEPEEERGGAGV